MATQSEIRSEITAKIITALESGTIPWRRPWTVSPNTGRPANAVSHKPYSGINPLLLELHRLEHGFQSKWWGTFKQWSDLGGSVMKRPATVKPGCWGCRIVYYSPISKTVIDPATGSEKEDKWFLLKTYTVFCADQVSGEKIDRFKVIDAPGTGVVLPNFEPAEKLIAVSHADIRFGGEQAFYHRPTPHGTWPHHTDGDFVQMPLRQKFTSQGGWYKSVLHELGHWSEVRTGWDSTVQGYPLSELAAEMGACFTANELGIPGSDDLTNHASYIQSWLAAMKNDPKFIFRASTQASKVTDYLMSFVRQAEPQPVADAAE